VSTPAVPEAVKTSVKPVSKGLSWPCPGEILYLDGKAYGVVIRAKLGEALKAVASGTVSSAGPYRGYGNVVFVLARGYIYVYGGNDSISVRAGDQVVAGQELGRVGMDVKQGGPAAYFLVFKNGEAVDPAAAPRG
jgi:septal ring factor EnvC (AmiA/AmiB activator)